MYREWHTAGVFVAASAALAAGTVLTLVPGAPITRAGAEPSTTTTPTSPAKPEFPSDARGYLESAARCDDGQTLMMFGRTSRSLVAVCVGPDGQLEYRGVRLSDEATLTMAATRAADGAIVATNDAVTYSINPQVLLVSENDAVLYRDPWLEYHKAGFPADPPTASPATSTSAASTTAASATPAPTADATTSPTVSTTTVTPAPKG